MAKVCIIVHGIGAGKRTGLLRLRDELAASGYAAMLVPLGTYLLIRTRVANAPVAHTIAAFSLMLKELGCDSTPMESAAAPADASFSLSRLRRIIFAALLAAVASEKSTTAKVLGFIIFAWTAPHSLICWFRTMRGRDNAGCAGSWHASARPLLWAYALSVAGMTNVLMFAFHWNLHYHVLAGLHLVAAALLLWAAVESYCLTGSD